MAERPDNEAFGRRLRQAKRDWEQSHDPQTISNEEIGRRVAALLKRGEPYSPQAVGKWMAGREPDTLDVVAAIAKVLGCDRAWLAWGPAVNDEPAKKRRNA